VQLTVNSRRPRYGEYREAWHLLREATGTRKKCPYTDAVPPCEGGGCGNEVCGGKTADSSSLRSSE
jgi:hypothetical protein